MGPAVFDQRPRAPAWPNAHRGMRGGVLSSLRRVPAMSTKVRIPHVTWTPQNTETFQNPTDTGKTQRSVAAAAAAATEPRRRRRHSSMLLSPARLALRGVRTVRGRKHDLRMNAGVSQLLR